MIRITTSFKDAVKSTLSEKVQPPRKRRQIKRVVSESNYTGPGDWSTANSQGTGAGIGSGSMSNRNVGSIDQMDIGMVEDKIAKNHPNPIFPLEMLPVNIMNAGEKISDLIPAIDSALKYNKVLTDAKKEELKRVKDTIKTILGNIRKVASIVDKLQN
jgi:hypothetical protein